jgi:DNA-directed RNA polymerase specialized sigma24 family protein
MTATGSVTLWLHQLEAGDAAAAQRLWEHFVERLVRRAGQKMPAAARRAAGEEDVVQLAFHSFFRGFTRGRFPQLQDRDDLWKVLLCLTERKACDLVRHERRQKRGGGRVVSGATPSDSADSSGAESPIDQVIGHEPTPEFAAQVAEEFRRLLGKLGDGEMRQIAIWKMEGYTNAEIAARIDYAIPTVERRLRLIRKTWESEGDP